MIRTLVKMLILMRELVGKFGYEEGEEPSPEFWEEYFSVLDRYRNLSQWQITRAGLWLYLLCGEVSTGSEGSLGGEVRLFEDILLALEWVHGASKKRAWTECKTHMGNSG